MYGKDLNSDGPWVGISMNILHIFGLQQSSWGLVQVVLLVSVSLSLVAVESGHLVADRKAVGDPNSCLSPNRLTNGRWSRTLNLLIMTRTDIDYTTDAICPALVSMVPGTISLKR